MLDYLNTFASAQTTAISFDLSIIIVFLASIISAWFAWSKSQDLKRRELEQQKRIALENHLGVIRKDLFALFDAEFPQIYRSISEYELELGFASELNPEQQKQVIQDQNKKLVWTLANLRDFNKHISHRLNVANKFRGMKDDDLESFFTQFTELDLEILSLNQRIGKDREYWTDTKKLLENANEKYNTLIAEVTIL
ncbi:hypothetical protein OU789_05665 [Halocynthiibacter sp. C4]|uniref:hypothetical protein n=1 Tax=Halocynthiibacter sp. C4 TaxID=2992758 RepID=UPI00237C0043|nr:hypothetical protein [Halocynthiibacter sp. C4]MDE0589404.1 hypothetical protein [Halocynthiibacter sp. C4]